MLRALSLTDSAAKSDLRALGGLARLALDLTGALQLTAMLAMPGWWARSLLSSCGDWKRSLLTHTGLSVNRFKTVPFRQAALQ